jgi:hypothetical protein
MKFRRMRLMALQPMAGSRLLSTGTRIQARAKCILGTSARIRFLPNEARDCVDVKDANCEKERNLIYNDRNTDINPCAGCGHNYHWLGPNSNTFVFETLENFGMTPPPIKNAPGYKHF